MARGRPPLFLQPEPYRKRRLIDAARLLPVFGTFLFVVPMLLLPRGVAGSTGDALIYLFLLWTLLILFSALINHYIRRAERASGPGAVVGRRTGGARSGSISGSRSGSRSGTGAGGRTRGGG